MSADDVDAVVDIDRRCQSSPTDAQVFLGELKRDWAHVDIATLTFADHSVRTVAFCNYWVVSNELQLHNIATHPDWRRRGIAAALMGHLLRQARAHACTLVTLEVRASNRAAQALYRRYEFRPVALRKHYYTDNREHAILMNLRLSNGDRPHDSHRD